MLEHPSILLAGIAARASLATERHLRLLNKPPLSELRTCPLSAHRTGASGDAPPFVSPSHPRGSAVEAGRPATQHPGTQRPLPIAKAVDEQPRKENP